MPVKDSYTVPGELHVSQNIPAGAAAADYDGRMFIANESWEVVEIREVHQTLGTDTGAVSLQVNKVPSGTALASGTSMLATAFDLKASINVPRTGALTTTAADLQLAAGDSIGLETAGTLTAVDGVTVQVVLRKR